MIIAFEGVDRVGKSTMIRRLASVLDKNTVKLMSFPKRTDSCTGTLINSILKGESSVAPQALTYLFGANFHEHRHELLDSTKIIICDRYIHSHVAYAHANGTHSISPSELPQPDIIIYMYSNTVREGDELFEKTAFQKKVAAEFDRLLLTHGNVFRASMDNGEDCCFEAIYRHIFAEHRI